MTSPQFGLINPPDTAALRALPDAVNKNRLESFRLHGGRRAVRPIAQSGIRFATPRHGAMLRPLQRASRIALSLASGIASGRDGRRVCIIEKRIGDLGRLRALPNRSADRLCDLPAVRKSEMDSHRLALIAEIIENDALAVGIW
jgi:hypothetical protein